MQLFGLVNTLLQNDRESSRRNLQAKKSTRKKSEISALKGLDVANMLVH
jgi:hypothetical protein